MLKQENSTHRVLPMNSLGSLAMIEVPFWKFDNYSRCLSQSGINRIRGLGEMHRELVIADNPKLFLGLYKLGMSLDKECKRLGKSICLDEEYLDDSLFELIYSWVILNGLPEDPSYFVSPNQDFIVDEFKPSFFDIVTKKDPIFVNWSFDAKEFAFFVLKFLKHAELALALKDMKKGFQNITLFKECGGNISDIKEEVLPVAITKHLNDYGGVEFFPRYDSAKQSYKIIVRAKSHLSAAYVQLMFLLTVKKGESIRECDYCHDLYSPNSRLKVCSEKCRKARSSQYVLNTLKKPKEERESKFVPNSKKGGKQYGNDTKT